jgi:hypothetical protein
LFLSGWIDVLSRYQAVFQQAADGMERNRPITAVDEDAGEEDESPRAARA